MSHASCIGVYTAIIIIMHAIVHKIPQFPDSFKHYTVVGSFIEIAPETKENDMTFK